MQAEEPFCNTVNNSAYKVIRRYTTMTVHAFQSISELVVQKLGLTEAKFKDKIGRLKIQGIVMG